MSYRIQTSDYTVLRNTVSTALFTHNSDVGVDSIATDPANHEARLSVGAFLHRYHRLNSGFMGNSLFLLGFMRVQKSAARGAICSR